MTNGPRVAIASEGLSAEGRLKLGRPLEALGFRPCQLCGGQVVADWVSGAMLSAGLASPSSIRATAAAEKLNTGYVSSAAQAAEVVAARRPTSGGAKDSSRRRHGAFSDAVAMALRLARHCVGSGGSCKVCP